MNENAERRPGGEFDPQAGAEGRELLRERIAAAIDSHGLIHLDARLFGDHDCCTDAILAALTEHLDIGEAEAWCKICRRVWDGPRHRCESSVERQAAVLREALAEALACLYALTRLDGSVIAWQTGNPIRPALYDRWQAALQPAAPETGHDSGPDIAECAAADRNWDVQKGSE
jgi:hypothetical protein